jgi:hypothetical protein
MQNRAAGLALAVMVTALAACGGSDSTTATITTTPASKILNFTASMTPSGEVGVNFPNNPTGSGSFSATLDTSTNVFTWTGTFSGLTTNVNNGHIHGPFTPGGAATSAGVILNFNPTVTPGATFTGFGTATSGAVSGTVTLNSALQLTSTVNGDSLRKLIIAGLTYVNIHTTANPGGEIRAQLVRKTQ